MSNPVESMARDKRAFSERIRELDSSFGELTYEPTSDGLTVSCDQIEFAQLRSDGLALLLPKVLRLHLLMGGYGSPLDYADIQPDHDGYVLFKRYKKMNDSEISEYIIESMSLVRDTVVT